MNSPKIPKHYGCVCRWIDSNTLLAMEEICDFVKQTGL